MALLILMLLGAGSLAAPQARLGELTHYGNRWAWSATGEVFVPQLVMYATPPHFYANPGKVDRDIQTFLADYGFSGFHVFLSCRWFDIGESDCREVKGSDPAVDPRTFEAVEMLIEKTHRAGGVVHLWAWGDEERGQTLSARPDWGGLDGPVARRVEREIAARLGDLPGWSMGYGFDLDEWVSAAEIHRWRDRLASLLPRPHFLGGRPGGPNRGDAHERYARWNGGLDYASYEHHKPSYAVYVSALEANPEKPVMSEDRFRVLDHPDPKHYTPQEVRRGLWHSMMAGGVANIWGYLLDGGSHELGSAPFPNRGQIRTYFQFVRGRFRKELRRCSAPGANPKRRTLCLGSPDTDRYLFYKEATERVELDLEALEQPQSVVAVDTRRPYAEIQVGELAPGSHVWRAPYRSDWALATGEFDRRPEGRETRSAPPMPPPSGLSLRGAGERRVELEWMDNAESETGYEVERAIDRNGTPGRFETVARVGPEVSRYVDAGVAPGETYWYRVGGLDDEGTFGHTDTLDVFVGSTGLAVSELRPRSYRLSQLSSGDRYYVDRDYTLSAVPAILEEAVWVRAANDGKLERGERFVSFQVTRPVTVYVGFDRRARSLPGWLDEWRDAGERVHVGGDRGMGYFELYRRDFAPGLITLGGNSAPGAAWDDSGRSHYVVAVVSR